MIESEDASQNMENILTRSSSYDYSLHDIAYSWVPELDNILQYTFQTEILYSDAYAFLVRELHYNGRRLSYIFHLPDLDAIAAYVAGSDPVMYFRDENAVVVGFAEEFIHFAQDYVYEGISNHPYVIDIEFEAKLLQDVENVRGNLHRPLRGDGKEHDIKYIRWLCTYFMESYYPAFETYMEGIDGIDYFDFMHDWKIKSNYSGSMSTQMPLLLEFIAIH